MIGLAKLLIFELDMIVNEFSVLISLYIKESPLYLSDCLESLYNQTAKASEIVIVYDGPVLNEHEAVVNKWNGLLPIKVVRLAENQGLGKALNIGLSRCSHELIARMDTDDICVSERFEKQLREFNLDSTLTLCGSSIEEVEGSTLEFLSNRTVPQSHEEIIQALPSKNPFNHMTVMYKKTHILDVGGYQPLHFMEDWYLWIRVLSAGYKSKNIPSNLVKARTGSSMIFRRSGISYIRSEYKMTLAKLFYSSCSIPFAFYIFFKRSLPRLLPKTLLGKVYLLSRKK